MSKAVSVHEQDHRGDSLNGRDLWRRVDALVDRMADDQIRAHGLLPLAALRRRETGREVPVDFAHELRATRTARMIVPALLTRIRGAVGGRLLVFKGPEVAARFP